MLKSLNHPNILHFIGILYQEGKVLTVITGMSHDSHMMSFVCIEFIGGGTLRKTIKKVIIGNRTYSNIYFKLGLVFSMEREN